MASQSNQNVSSSCADATASTPPLDPIGAFRQPVITTTGILLGFILNFAATWVRTETSLPDWVAYIIGIFVIVGVICLMVTMYRMLKFDYPRTNPHAVIYYTTTLNLMMIGIALSFIGAFIDLLSNFYQE
jgi:predicted permease